MASCPTLIVHGVLLYADAAVPPQAASPVGVVTSGLARWRRIWFSTLWPSAEGSFSACQWQT